MPSFPIREVIMRTIVQTGIVAGITSLSLAFPVAADISAIEARNEIVGFYESFGYTVDIGSEKISDGALLLDDVSIQVDIPDGKGQIVIAYDWVKMTETGGAVDITFPDTIEITGNVDDEGKEAVFAAHIDATNMAINLSGSMDNLRIRTNIYINIAEAVLGTELSVKTITGKRVKLQIPPGTSSAKIFRIPGLGVKNESGQGDHFVRIEIDVPPNLSIAQKRDFRNWAKKVGLVK